MKTISLVFILCIFFSCQNKEKPALVQKTTNIILPDSTSLPKNQVENTVKAFFLWYSKNYNTVNQYDILNDIVAKDTSKQDAINFNEADLFLACLKSSNYLSQSFLENMKQYFDNYNKFVLKLSDEKVENKFDADLILLTPEIEQTLNAIENMKEIKFEVQCSENKATARVQFETELKIKLTNTDNKWLIDSIEEVEHNTENTQSE